MAVALCRFLLELEATDDAAFPRDPRALEPNKCDCLGLPPLPRLKMDRNSSCIVPYAVVRENDVGAATFVAVVGGPVTVAGPLAGLGLLFV